MFLFARPLSALGVLGFYVGASCVVSGVADLLAARREPSTDRLTVALPWVWILVGLALLVWLGHDLDAFGPTVAVLLIVSGLVALVRLARDRSLERVTGALFGVADILFGVLVLLWPDAGLIVVAALFGARTALFGLSLVIRGTAQRLRGSTEPSEASPRRARWLTGLRVVAAVCVVALAVGATWVSHSLRSGAPVVDAFYDTPDELPSQPGALIRYDAYTGQLPEDLVGYRIYYTTTDERGTIVPSSGLLVVPKHQQGPAPLITWAHGTVGVARPCAPSINDNALDPAGVPDVDKLGALGWAMVATDYPGMGAAGNFPYLIGQGQGRATLDAVRAAHAVPGVSLDPRTVIWGHSQGGHAALWAGQLAGTYAPELDIVGTAALSPASDPRQLAESVLSHPEVVDASLGVAFVVDSYVKYYPDLSFDDVVTPGARAIVREAATRCTSQTSTLVTALSGLAVSQDQSIVQTDALSGPFGKRLTDNIPLGPWSAPLFLGQGESDEVISFRINQNYVARLCAQGTDLTFTGYAGGTHMSVLTPGGPLVTDLTAWTQDRLAGKPATSNCPP